MRSPFPNVCASRPHFENEHIQVWLLDPLGMATRIVGPVHVTLPMIQIVTEVASRALMRLHRHAPVRMRFMHDWRGVTGYDPAARQAILSGALALGVERLSRVDVLFERSSCRLLTMGITAAQAAFSALGVEFCTYRFPDELLLAGGSAMEARVRLDPPPASRRPLSVSSPSTNPTRSAFPGMTSLANTIPGPSRRSTVLAR
jgi:hypothetical protein